MGRDEIGQRNSNRLFGLTSELGNATSCSRRRAGVGGYWARPAADTAALIGLYIAAVTPSSNCTPQLFSANDTMW